METTLEEWVVTTESKKPLTADRARRILRQEVEALSKWHSPGLPVLVKMGNRWRAMRSTDVEAVWKYYYIEQIDG